MGIESSYSIEKVLEADDVHLYCESSLCLDMTSTFEAAKKEE